MKFGVPSQMWTSTDRSVGNDPGDSCGPFWNAGMETLNKGSFGPWKKEKRKM
jgi:hypothetical protein